MVTVEEILSEIGEDELSSHDSYKNLIFYLNVSMRGYLPSTLDGTETGFSVLGLIYEVPELDKQQIILSKVIKYDGSKQDKIKYILTIMMIIMVAVVLFMAVNALFLEEALTTESTDILKMIVYNVFELVKHLLDVSYPTSP